MTNLYLFIFSLIIVQRTSVLLNGKVFIETYNNILFKKLELHLC